VGGVTQTFPGIELDEYGIMPNHFHGVIVNMVGATLVVAQGMMDDGNRAGINPAPTLGDIVGAFKSITTHEYIRGVHESDWPPFDKRVWQRNYFEHIIRNERELDRIREYIVNNPLKWALDTEHPNAKR
jgi:putative transposase